MKINDRLKMIGDFVPLSSCPLDIGCDHALLSIYLVKMRGFKKVVASDNKQGPLDSAKKNIQKYQVEENIILRLADGLKSYDDKIDTVTISGMGGMMINQMIETDKKFLSSIEHFIISPNNHIDLVKKKMMKLGFMIKEEQLVKEKHFIYEIIHFVKGKKKYNKKDLFLGPILKQAKNELTLEYYRKRLQDKKQLLKLLPPGHFSKRRQLKKEIKWLEETIC